ncbi:AMP-binding protein [Flexithrix dorotheae]|uniref:AMP-binding protein n=1 Tax=Flexithrix dorotheae TaxID=70993 RepID=UPI0003800C12|nr:AMP-binding protein [Flexithrix dorotheae]
MEEHMNIAEKKSVENDNEKLESLIEKFYHKEKALKDKTYLRQPHGDSWTTYTWGEVGRQARCIASALKAMDLPPKSNIGIISKNCAHWIMNDLAIMMSGHISVPFYPNLNASQLEHVLEHGQIQVLFVGKLDNWDLMKPGVLGDIKCISYPNSPATEYENWDDLIEKHEPLKGNPVPDIKDILTIIYTSGTTGRPKGVMVTNEHNSRVMKSVEKIIPLYENEQRFFSYLPLCHVAERGVVETCSIYSGGTISFVESIDTFVKNLQDTQPTIFFAVPRIWTKFQLGVLEKMPQKKLDLLMKIPVLSGIIKKKILTKLGLGKVIMAFTAAAPTPVSLHLWYQKLGLKLLELYGMTENMGACSVMPPKAFKLETIGIPYPGVEVKIDKDTNEILMKSDWIMKGYYREPEMTADVLKNGYLHTGDMGELDEEGYLKITGRVKDMFKTAKGEYVVPGPIEWDFSADAYIEQICVMGTGLPQPIALIQLSEVGKTADKSAVEHSFLSLLSLINVKLVDYQKVKKIVITKDEWSIENDIITPTMKIKRNKIDALYLDKAEKWYNREDVVIWE